MLSSTMVVARRAVPVLVIGCVLAFLPACSLEEVAGLASREKVEAPPPREGYRAVLRPATWALERVSRDGTVIWIWSAKSGCNEFHHAEVREVEGGLRVKALDRVFVPLSPRYRCLLPLFAIRHRVELPRPLGPEDKIFGECPPGEATPEQRMCASMHEAAAA